MAEALTQPWGDRRRLPVWVGKDKGANRPWRFILCINLTELRVPQKAGMALPLSVSVRVFLEGIRFDSMDRVKHMALPKVGGHLLTNPSWAPKWNKKADG